MDAGKGGRGGGGGGHEKRGRGGGHEKLSWIYWNCRCQFVHVYVSKKALGTSIRNTFELHLFENGLYRKRRYMHQNQAKFGG